MRACISKKERDTVRDARVRDKTKENTIGTTVVTAVKQQRVREDGGTSTQYQTKREISMAECAKSKVKWPLSTESCLFSTSPLCPPGEAGTQRGVRSYWGLLFKHACLHCMFIFPPLFSGAPWVRA